MNDYGETNTEVPFWIVANEQFPTTISYRHPTYESAYEEARRLARQTHNTFVILRAVTKLQLRDIEETLYEEGADIPF
jgi:hypothetical protein